MHENRLKEQWNRIESPQVNPYSFDQLIFQNSYQENSMWERIIFSISGARTTVYPHAKTWSSDFLLTPHKLTQNVSSN